MMGQLPMNELCIDINADLGESEESLANGADFELMRYITSANVACGGHAGDERTMRETVRIAKQLERRGGSASRLSRPRQLRPHRVAHGAGRDRSFGARSDCCAAGIAAPLGVRLVHCKPHGALYHAANKSAEIAAAIGRAVLESDEQLIMVGQAGSATLTLWESMGLSCAAEAFADRAYEPDGILRKRTLPGALLDDPARAAQQAGTSPPGTSPSPPTDRRCRSAPPPSAFIPTRLAAWPSHAR